MMAAFVVLAVVEFSGLLGFEWKRSGWTFTPSVDPARAVYLLAGLMAFYWVWQYAQLKCVTMDQACLYVSNWRTEIQIPLVDIADVRETGSYWFRIVIALRKPSSFGSTIVFQPTFRIYLSGLHPVASKLRESAEQAHSGNDAESPDTLTRPLKSSGIQN